MESFVEHFPNVSNSPEKRDSSVREKREKSSGYDKCACVHTMHRDQWLHGCEAVRLCTGKFIRKRRTDMTGD